MDHLTHGMPARCLMDDFKEICLETVMARERDYQPTLRRVAIAVVTTTSVVVPGGMVGPGAPLEGTPP